MEKALEGFGNVINFFLDGTFLEVELVCDDPSSIPGEQRILLGNLFYVSLGGGYESFLERQFLAR